MSMIRKKCCVVKDGDNYGFMKNANKMNRLNYVKENQK